MRDKLVSSLGSVLSGITNMRDSVVSSITNLFNRVSLFFDEFFTIFEELLDYLFVPSDDYIESKLNPIYSKFQFFSEIYNYVLDMIDFLKSCITDSPPILTIDLTTINSKYNYGASAITLDLSFYEPYKPYGDMIFTFFICPLFFWRLFLASPQHLAGASSLAHTVADD